MLTNSPLASNIFSAKCQHSEVRTAAVIACPEIASNMRKIAQLGDLQLRLGRTDRPCSPAVPPAPGTTRLTRLIPSTQSGPARSDHAACIPWLSRCHPALAPWAGRRSSHPLPVPMSPADQDGSTIGPWYGSHFFRPVCADLTLTATADFYCGQHCLQFLRFARNSIGGDIGARVGRPMLHTWPGSATASRPQTQVAGRRRSAR
jgi:hypothetical protein